MYCKHCGKEIADDSNFCNYCGGKQFESETKDKEAPIDRIVSKLFIKFNNKYFYTYVVWVVLNLIFLCYGRSNALVKFFPFTHFDGWENRDTPYFNLSYYDSTEFITYVILIPLLVFLYFKYWHEPLKRKIKGIKKKNDNNETSFHDTEKSEISKLEAVLEEPSNITDDTRFCQQCDGVQDSTQSEPIVNGEQNTINDTELHQTIDEEKITEEEKQDESKGKNKESKKIDGCITAFLIVLALLFTQFFIRPMAKLYMRQRMNHQIEASGVYGAGLDRAEPIMAKLKKEAPSCLGQFGEFNKISYAVGTITMEFIKADYNNSIRYRYYNGNAKMEFVMSEIQATPNSFKKILEEIVEENFSLSIEIHPSETTIPSYTIINFSPYELGKVLNR